eukprot:4371589-Prymnesium_polylepis.1
MGNLCKLARSSPHAGGCRCPTLQCKTRSNNPINETSRAHCDKQAAGNFGDRLISAVARCGSSLADTRQMPALLLVLPRTQ